jgi:uncharacterized protein
LHIVSNEGHADMVDLVSEFKDCLLEKVYENRTHFHLAAMNGHLDVIRKLVNASASIEAKDNLGFTTLNYAIEYGRTDVVYYLRQFQNAV